MNCKDFREIADSYLSNELLIETNHEVLRHLENCADCRRELAARRNLRDKLCDAVKNAPQSRINTAFASRLTNDLRETALAKQGSWIFAAFIDTSPVLTGILVVLILSVSTGLVWKFGKTKNSPEISNLNPPPAIKANTEKETRSLQIERASFIEMEKDAVNDHKDCALKFCLPEKPISLDEAAKIYGTFNKDLDKAVFAPLRENLGDQVKFLEAHSCIINGQRFAHIVVAYRDRKVSILIARRENEGDAENGDAISCKWVEDFRVSCFQTDKFGVFVVSDLEETENLKIARTILSAVRKHFEQSEIGA